LGAVRLRDALLPGVNRLDEGEGLFIKVSH